MPKSKQQKEEMVKKLAAKIKESKSSVFFNYDGLTVADSDVLRYKGKLSQVEVMATKKTFLKLALVENQINDLDTKSMSGSLAIAVSKDEVSAARLVKDFAKGHEQVQFKGGVLEGKAISIDSLKFLADLPSKQELLAKLVYTIKAPVTGLVNVLKGNLRGLVNVLNAIKENK